MINLTKTQQIALLMKDLNTCELKAIYDLAWDLKYKLEQVEIKLVNEVLRQAA